MIPTHVIVHCSDSPFGDVPTIDAWHKDRGFRRELSRVRPGVPVVFLDTGYHFAETVGTRDAVRVAYPVRLIDVTPRRSVAEQDADEGPRLFERNPDRCCAPRGGWRHDFDACGLALAAPRER